ncbi:MinD/ParA family protein [Clostridium hydrogenum]|uniref:MinD/ParA family protein n=1 Tax=Clostridium hydrogenum TaxID=2855764 RepID=UPI001F273C6E|nr:MinD/ParA family protein [Clostridium hydrogenum]
MLDQAQRLREMAMRDHMHKKPNGTKVITVTSGKGGVGKSNIVVNLSITLQKMGKKVLIFDADVGMGNDDVLMGFLPRYNIFDVIYNGKDINDVIITGPYGVKLLPGGSGIAKINELSEEQIDNFLLKLCNLNDLDYIIMDTGAGVNRSVLGFIACSDELVIVTTPEPTSLTDAYSLFKAVVHFKIKSNAKIIINRAFTHKEGVETYKKFAGVVNKFIKAETEFLWSVSDDSKLVQAVRNQKPVVISSPNCNASKDIEIIAKKIEGLTYGKNGVGIEGLFKKIFNIFS